MTRGGTAAPNPDEADGEEAPRAVEILLEQIDSGGRRFARLILTDNRRVMISVGDGGATLRLNHRFATAPLEVLRAIGAMYGASGRHARAAARSTVLAHLRRFRLPSSAPRPRPRLASPGDADRIARLRAEFDRVNAAFFDGTLPTVPIVLSGRMRSRNGHFSTQPLEIVISRRLLTSAAPGEAEHTLRHEMIHLSQHVSGRTPGHGRDFRAEASRLGVHPRAKRRVRYTSSVAP